jgi:hypothetical protein
MRLPTSLLAIISAGILLAACADNSAPPGGQNSSAPQSGQFTGVALPEGYSLDNDRSLALGAGDKWIGRISFTSGMSTNDMFDFYRREMPKYGWVEGTVVRGESSLITFTSSATSRVAVVQITGRTLGGAHVDLVVSPQTDAASDSGAMPAGHPGAVTAQPLH